MNPATYLVLLRHEARRALKSLLPRAVFVIMPIGLVAFLRSTFEVALRFTPDSGADGSLQVVPGMAVMFGFVILVYFGYTSFDDFGFGMWDRLRVAGVRSAETLSAKASVMFVHLLVHFTIVFTAGIAVLGLDVEGTFVGLVAVLVATAAMCTAYAFAAFAFATSNALYNAACYVGALSLSAVGGGLVPLGMLPSWAQSIAPATPAYWALQGCRLALTPGHGLSAVLPKVLALLGFAALFVLIGVWRFDPATEREAFNI